MAKDIKGTTRVCGIIGNPVHHTMSPAIHNTLNELTDTDMVYVPFEVKEKDVEAAIRGALALDLLGLNVTIPHKSAVIPHLKEIDDVAGRIGAVNTLVRTADGTGFKGYNTDYTGLLRSLQEKNTNLAGESVVILGAGGVARPAAFLCANEGAKEIFVLNRTFGRAEQLCSDVNAYAGKELAIPMELSAYKELPADRKYICLQMTQVGLYPDSDKAVIEDPEFYKMVKTGFDAVYRPLTTRFLQYCRDAGAVCVSGLKMLLYQGVDAYEKWNNITVSPKECEFVYGKLLSELLEGRNIVLTGFMGSGKSSVGKELCRILGYEMIDTDAEIEKEQNTSISQIFDTLGEEAFRDMETDYVKRLSEGQRSRTLLSVGGGLPVREENRRYLHEFGAVIFLKATPETVYDRVKDDDSRPLLRAEDVLERIKEIQEQRRPGYSAAADIEIDTDSKSLNDIASAIIEMLL